jgi:hypothetical protein
MPRLAALLLTLLLAACASPVAPERRSEIKSVAVLSALGDEVTMRAIGITVFGNADQRGRIEGLGLDEAVTARLGALLAPRYEVREVKFDRAALGPDRVYFNADGGLFDRTRRPVEEAVKAAMAGQPADAYLLVTPGSSGFNSTNQGLQGVGVVKSGVRIGGAPYMLYALYVITVVDGRDFSQIGAARPAAARDLMPVIRGPTRNVDRSWWAETPGALGPEQQRRLKAGLAGLVGDTLPETVRKLQLLP